MLGQVKQIEIWACLAIRRDLLRTAPVVSLTTDTCSVIQQLLILVFSGMCTWLLLS